MSDTSLKDISKLKVADLKRELKVRGLSTVGNKQELQDRLQVVLQDGTDSSLLLDDTGTVDTEDILNEDDVLADEDDSNTIATPDEGSASLKRQLDEELDDEIVTSTPGEKGSVAQPQDNGPPAKKITLNRKAISQQVTPTLSEKSDGEEKKDEKDDGEKKVVKLSEISMKERLALRAVKFGAPASVEAKKVARAARFGETASADSKKEARAARFGSSASSVTSAGNVPEVNVDLLKKRAERFGVQAGSKIELVEMEERKKKRLERFGGSSTPSTTSTTSTNGSSKVITSKPEPVAVSTKPGRVPITAPSSSVSIKANLDDKKKMRAERFKSSTAVSAK
ncbi:SAP domain-containing ribonucleoprotein isoform X1 [Frankliniella occidentalis]|uniref:SAP domain-containing ribonucleoprotein isoform X1 n=1 Tax=Frankliniella occidentalis TaxID=133901 RepID=A0A6J1TAQ5_FRAOC|nr:SAP domain-containing ribonucleoprotein isoform X1 [Frankliniella occidentalis]